jgi:hypothetical protein
METLIEERDHATAVRRPMTPDAPEPSSLRAWIAAEPQRACPHLDFGSRWVDPARPGRHHRVSWIPTTGELYVTDPDESYVQVLGVVQDRARLATLFTGWGTIGARPDAPLSWIVDRITEPETEAETGPGAGTDPGGPEATNDAAGDHHRCRARPRPRGGRRDRRTSG